MARDPADYGADLFRAEALNAVAYRVHTPERAVKYADNRMQNPVKCHAGALV